MPQINTHRGLRLEEVKRAENKNFEEVVDSIHNGDLKTKKGGK